MDEMRADSPPIACAMKVLTKRGGNFWRPSCALPICWFESDSSPSNPIVAQASSAQGGRSARERVAGDAPVRRHAAAQPNLCPLAAPPQSTRLQPLVPAEPRSYPPYHGLPGVEPEKPNPPKETASAAGLPTPVRRRS